MSITLAIVIFITSAVIIVFAGTALTKKADQLADKTGLGEALVGAIFLGAVTSIAGIITSIVAAYSNHPQLAISNAIGGIAAQTIFLCVADVTYRKINLEHAAASLANLMQGVLLIGLLSLVMAGVVSTEFTLFNIHPISYMIVLAYIFGARLISVSKDQPQWNPKKTSSTVEDDPESTDTKQIQLKPLILKFVALSVLVGGSGYAIAVSGIAIADSTSLSEGLVGSIFTAVATSLPELIVTLAAVRQKALTLAIGNIIGGNSFDVLFIAFADIAFQEGSILHHITHEQTYLVCLTMIMVSILIMGLLHRQRKGIANIGWESLMIILVYVLGNGLLYYMY